MKHDEEVGVGTLRLLEVCMPLAGWRPEVQALRLWCCSVKSQVGTILMYV